MLTFLARAKMSGPEKGRSGGTRGVLCFYRFLGFLVEEVPEVST